MSSPPAADFTPLLATLSPSSTLTINPPASTFPETYANWGNDNLHTPLAILQPKSESDISSTLRFAAANSIRVSARSGGHSAFNTLPNGIIIDLQSYNAITYDPVSETITVQGGAQGSDVMAVAASHSRCALTGSCNSVGMTALYVGGGFSPLTPKLGLAVDNLVSARLLLASGDVLTVSKSENADVFDVLRGAGQILGVVSELRIKTYPLAETVGSEDGTVWKGSVIFASKSAKEVAQVVDAMEKTEKLALYMLVSLPPPELEVPPGVLVVVLILTYFGDTADAEEALKPVYDLDPVAKIGERVPYVAMNNGNDGFAEKGGFKRMFGAGLNRVSGDALERVVGELSALSGGEGGADFSKTCVLIEMLGMGRARESNEGVYPHRGVNYWGIPMTWYYDPKNHKTAEQWGTSVRRTMKEGDTTQKAAVYCNFRAGDETQEELWGSKETAEKVMAMKRRLDPEGMFLSF